MAMRLSAPSQYLAALQLSRGLKCRIRRVVMKKPAVCLLFVSLLALHGCFDNSGNETKNNTDNSKSSVQMHEGESDKSK
jgi:hypothetical protein